jgi:AraC-like DNA-binding protein
MLTMTRTGFISMRVVRTLADAVAQAGVSPMRLLQAGQLEPTVLSNPDARIPTSKLYELLGHALDLTGDPAFGLHSIERMSANALNPVSGLVVHAATVRQAFASIQDFRRLLGDDATFQWHEADDKVYVQCNSPRDQPLRIRRYLTEVTLAGLYGSLKEADVAQHVELVAFDYEPPAYAAEYTRVFAGRARFRQPTSGLRLNAEVLSARPHHADAQLHEALSVFAARRVLQLSEKVPYAARVHEALVWQRRPRDMNMTAVARRLGVSVRSLRRYLLAEGKTFAQVAADALACVAKRALLVEQRSIAETARELGFSDETSFHRAFKRWTGTTPMRYRRESPG